MNLFIWFCPLRQPRSEPAKKRQSGMVALSKWRDAVVTENGLEAQKFERRV